MQAYVDEQNSKYNSRYILIVLTADMEEARSFALFDTTLIGGLSLPLLLGLLEGVSAAFPLSRPRCGERWNPPVRISPFSPKAGRLTVSLLFGLPSSGQLFQRLLRGHGGAAVIL